MDTNHKIDPEVVLQNWRTRILNGFLVIVAIIVVVMSVVTVFDAMARPGQWTAVIVYLILMVAMILLAVFRGIEYRIRAWGTLLVPYVVGLIALATFGLGSSGRLYMMAVPIAALILIGTRPGMIMSGISVLTLVAFAVLANSGLLAQTLIRDRNSLLLADWLAEFFDTLGLLVIVMVVLILFYRFQERLIASERGTQAELIHTQKLLEEQNATLEQRVQERTEELVKSNKIQTALYKITEAASASHDMHEFYAQIHRIVGELMYAGNFFIATYDEQSGLLSFPYFVDEVQEAPSTQPLENFHGMTSWVIRTGRTVTHGWNQSNELLASGEISLPDAGPGNEDGIAAPLKIDGKTIGVVFVQSYTKGIGYTEQDEQILEFVARHIATALTRARALEEIRQRNSELHTINSIGELIVKTLDLKILTRLVGDQMREIFDVDSSMIMLLDRESNMIQVLYEFDRNEGGYIEYVQPFPLGTGLSSKVITTGQPLMANTLEEETANGAYFPPEIIARGSGFYSESWLGVPILSSDQVLGLIALADNRPHMFNQNQIRLLQTLSSNLGAAIENAHLFEAEQDRVAELLVINNVQKALASKLDVHAIYELIGEQIREVFNVEVVDIVTYDPGTNLMSMPYSYENGDRSVIAPQPPYGFRLQVINTGEALLVNQNFMELATQSNNPVLTGEWPKSALFVPLLVNGQVGSIVSIQDLEKENAFTESDVRLLQTLANSMSIALENARLFDETGRLLEETRRAKETAETLRSANLALTQNLDMAAICDELLTFLYQIAPYDSATIFLLESETHLIVQATRGYEVWMKNPIPAQTAAFDIVPGTVMHHVINGNSFLIDDTTLVKEWVVISGEEYILSWLGVPMMIGDRIIGVISLDKNQVGFFNQEMVQLATSLGTQAAFAIQNARLYHNQELARAQAETLYAVTQALSRTLSLQEVFDLILTELEKVVPYDSCSVQQLYGDYSVIVGGRGFPNLIELLGMRFLTTDPNDLSWNVIQTRTPHIEEDVSARFAHFKDIEGAAGLIHGWLGVPLIFGDRVIGMLALDKRERAFFTPEHAQMAMAFAAQAAVAIENARFLESEHTAREQAERQALENARLFDETQRLLKETEQRNHELSIINNIQQALASKLDLQAIIDLFGDEVRRIYPPQERIANNYSVYIALYDAQTQMISFPYLVDGAGERFTEPPTPLGPGLTSSIIRSGQPLLLKNAEEQIAHGVISFTQINQAIGSQSWLGVPIQSGDQVIGVISMQDNRQNLFTDADVRILGTLAASLAVALDNARLFGEVQQRAAELAIINSVQAGLASKLDMQAIYELVGEKIREIFDAQEVDIATYDYTTDLLTDRYSFEKGDRTVLPHPVLSFGFRKHVIQSRQPMLVNEDVEAISTRYGNPTQTGASAKSCVFVPMIVGEEVIGVVSLQNMDRENAFSNSNVRLLQTLANSMSVALENARLFGEVQQHAAELAIINSVQGGLASKLEIQEIYDLVGDKIRAIFDAQFVALGTLDQASRLACYHYVIQRGQRIKVDPIPYAEIAEYLIHTRQPLLFNQNATDRILEMGGRYVEGVESPKSALYVPLIAGEDVQGAILLENMDRENAFSDSDVRLLQTLASSMSVALENARLFDETQRLLKETEQRAAELATVNTVSSAITGELELDALIHLVGEQIRSVFKTDIAYVALLDREGNMINFPYQYGQQLEPMQYGEGLTSRVIESGTPLIINEDLERQREELGAAQYGRRALSYLGVPIFAGGEAIGVVSVQSTTREGIFTENDQHLLSTIAANVGIALQNARLFEEIKHQEQFARETQRRLADIIDFLPDATLVIDQEARVIAWNHAMEEMTGVAAEAMLGKGDYEYAIPFYGERRPILIDLVHLPQQDIEKKYAHIQRTGGILTGEALTPSLKGEARFLYATASTLHDAQNNFAGAIEIIRDITDRKHTENELRESNEKLRLIFENAFDGISIYEELPDEDRRVLLDCNERYCEMAGRSKDKLLAIHDTRSVQRDLGVGTDRFDFEPITAGRAFSGVFSWIRPDSRENIIEYNAAPTRVGERYFTISLDRDVTERKHTEEELKKARASAEAANQAKSAFLANMSHELRTPLNAIIGFTRIVRRKAEGVLPDKQTENLDKVLTSAEHLLNLINTVLDIAKIEAGRMDVLAANFRIAALVDLCANTAQPLLKPGVTLEKEVDEHLTYVYSDQDKIRQIVLNLLSNAAKFTQRGKIVLAARQAGENLRISVSDTGIGIAAEALPRIFNEFQQADTSTTRQYGGTGLGLSISRNLAHLLGGDLIVESELGKGSTFTLIIPLHYGYKPALQADQEPALAQEAGIDSESPSIRKRVLVIDDDPDAVYLLQENLNQQEFEILGARSGLEGLELARKLQPGAILLDIVMPGADGWHVLHDLKADPVTSSIPVVFLSIVDKKALGLQLGAAAYLLKPLDPVEVRDTLNRVIGRSGARPKRVLVIDDDPNIADMLCQFLPESDFQVVPASDGIAGLEAVEACRPDILLLDIIMPRLDGFGVIEKLRANPQTSDLPIVVLSAKELTASESARLKETVAGVMKKQGLEAAKLIAEINRALGNSQPANKSGRYMKG